MAKAPKEKDNETHSFGWQEVQTQKTKKHKTNECPELQKQKK